MKFSQDVLVGVNRVHAYDERSVTIQTKTNLELVKADGHFILSPEILLTEWPINLIADFTLEDVNYFKALDLEVLLVSQASSNRLAVSIIAEFSKQAIGLEQMDLGAACRTYNLLVSEGRREALIVNF